MEKEYYYRYRQKLNISHSMGANSIHNHTIDIEILVRNKKTEFSMFNDNEKLIKEYFSQYEGKYINELEAFKNTQSTIEDMGYVFYEQLKDVLNKTDFELYNISVSETPSRQYVVSDYLETGLLDDSSSKYERLLDKYIEKNKEDVLNSYKKNLREERDKRLTREIMLANEKKNASVTKEDKPKDNSGRDLTPEEIAERERYSSARNRKIYGLDSYGLVKKKGVNKFEIVLYIIVSILLSIGLFFILKNSDILQNTEEIYIHLGKARYLLGQLRKGIISPIYMKSWYDGYMMFMHSEPLTYYVLALMGYLFNADMMTGYAATLALIFLLTVCGFTFFGRVYDKALIGFICGILWFTMPEISRHYLITGDVKVLMALAFLPFCFAYISKYFQNRGKFMQLKIIASMWLIVLADLSIAIVVFVGFALIFTIKVFYTKQDKKLIATIGCIIMAIGLSAGWLYSAYRNGSIPEFYTNNNGYYIGITLFLILVGCILFAYKQLRVYSIVGIIAGMLALYKLPVIVIIMYLAVIFVFIEWKKCDRKVILVLLLVIGISNVYRMGANVNIKDYSLYEENRKIANAVKEAEVATNDNLLYLDIDKEATYPGYYMVSKDKDIIFSNKSSMKYNVITDNIQMLKYAIYTKRFDYIFDRSTEMGCDTILFNLKGLIITQEDSEKLDKATKKYGFDLISGSINSKYLIYHKNINRNIGNITKYSGVAIGKSARNISLIYPCFEDGKSNNLDDYSFEELSQYKKIYLSGFTYKKLSDAENKIKKLAKKGVDIYIDMDSLQPDPLTNRQKFLGVTAQTVSFKEKFPEFNYKQDKITPKKFYKDYREWNTVYVENMEKVTGYCKVSDRTLPYAGDKYEKVHFMGLNILYHVIEANDVSIQFIIDDFFGLEEGEAPERIQKHLNIKYEFDKIKIDSEYDNMIVPISYQRVFRGNSKIKNVNNMLMVNKGRTELTFDYKNFRIGVIISITMIIIMIVIFAVYRRKVKYRR